MPPIPPACRKALRHPKIKLSGPRTSTLYLLNPERREVERIIVDGCAITEGPRCDWLVRTVGPLDYGEIFVELKSRDIGRAFEQLEASVVKLACRELKPAKRRCFVVTTQTPRLGTTLQIAKSQFKRKYDTELQTVSDDCEIKL